jgi:hypothetical protein
LPCRLLAYGEEVCKGAGTIEIRFVFPLPDHAKCFLPSFSLGSRKVMWFAYATVELASGAIYRYWIS